MTLPVKWFTSEMTGAPSMSDAAGDLIALLDACLVNGFGTLTLTSLNVASGIATAQIDAGHDYLVDSVIEIAAATPVGLNGEHRVLTVTATQFTFATTESDGLATGTITAKVAALGWTKPHSGTHKGAYRNGGVDATGCHLRVNDDGSHASGRRVAQIRGYETMTDVDTGTNEFPLVAQTAADPIIIKSIHEDSTILRWVLIGDNRRFYLFLETYTLHPGCRGATFFGDIVPLLPTDDYHCLLIGASNVPNLAYSPGYYSSFKTLNSIGVTESWQYLARSYVGSAGAVAAGKLGDNAVSTNLGFGGAVYPHGLDNGLLAARVRVNEVNIIRGFMPGLYQPLHTTPLADLATLSGMPDVPDRTIMAINLSRSHVYGQLCQAMVDITGPWE